MTDKLHGVHPILVAKVGQIQMAMTELRFPMVVTDGVRTDAQQAALYAQGRTAPGPVVTHADGVQHRSNHQTHADGYGHAVDMAFLDTNGRPSWDDSYPWALYGAMGKALRLVWGGEFTTIPDRPHLELPETR